MREEEYAERVTVWDWAAETLGQEVTKERMKGLVYMTAQIRLEILRPAMEMALRQDTAGFLPAPGRLVKCAEAVAREQDIDRPLLPPPGPASDREMNELRRALNPHGWDVDKLRAYVQRIGVAGPFKQEAKAAHVRRARWAEERFREEFGDRNASHRLRLREIRANMIEAYSVHPKPDPYTWGMPEGKRWTPPNTSNLDDAFRMGR